MMAEGYACSGEPNYSVNSLVSGEHVVWLWVADLLLICFSWRNVLVSLVLHFSFEFFFSDTQMIL